MSLVLDPDFCSLPVHPSHRLDSWSLATVITMQCLVFSALGARMHAAATVHVLRGFALVSSCLVSALGTLYPW
ncbi:hypothetical protein OH76DRAFT_1491205 [Lentinus brumalis]|uniref:Uncharacterized protein n=1 Tax=Lentinus brumalis TaxID=2498619 RepID=A0A371CGL5_9APHY|nr:hypothetical protein OH76DRAFT_1491205 [Polyporus brumalis]